MFHELNPKPYYYRVTRSLRSSRPPATKLRLTGPPSSPRPSRDRTSRSSSPTSALPPLPPLPLPPLVVLLPLRLPLPPRRRRSPRRKRLMSTWVASSVTTIEQARRAQL